MTNIEMTKRALLSSILALLLCFTMLLGMTYAWFTDSFSSDSNLIQAGNLDIEVDYTLDGSNWDTLNGANDIFTKGLWEPGHTEIVAIRITNSGTLAVNYTAHMNIVEEKPGTNKEEKLFFLSEILQVTTKVIDDGNDLKDYFSDEGALKGNESLFKNVNVLGDKNEGLSKGEIKYILIKVDMPDTIGNEANAKGIAYLPSIEFGINVFATQRAEEEDSFGKDYDEGGWDGTYPTEMPETFVVDLVNKTIRIQDEYAFAYLKTWLEDADSYDKYDVPVCTTIVFEEDLNMGNKPWQPLTLTNFVLIDGGNHTIKNLKVEGANNVGLFGTVGNGKDGKTTVKNFIINGADVKGEAQVSAFIGINNSATIDNVHVKNATVVGTANVGGIEGRSYKAVINSSVVNSTITGGKRVGGISGFSNSNNTESPVYSGNVVDNVKISGERVGGFIGQSAAGNGGITVKDSTVKNCTITATIDSTYYPANDFIGNNTSANGASTTLENNTAENNTLN